MAFDGNGQAHVLWVERTDRDFAPLRKSLSAARFRLARAESVADAIEVLSSLPVEVVVVDPDLPDSRGTSAIRLVREQAPYVPIVALVSDNTRANELLEAGAEEVLGTNALPAVVLRVLRHAIDRARWSAQTRQLLRIQPDAALVVDARGTVLFANGPAERMFGRDIAGRTLSIAIVPGVRREPLPEELGSGQAEIRVVEVIWGGRRANVVSVRRLEEPNVAFDDRLAHLSRLASVGALCASVTHEANNLGMGVIANLSLLQHHFALLAGHPAVPEEIDALLEESIQTVKRMSSMLADICAFSRKDGAGVEWVDVNDVVTTACRWIQKRLQQQARLVTALGEVPPIAADPTELRQVLVNLLLNAVQAIERRGGSDHRIKVETRTEGDKLVVTVEDTGSGIPPDLKKQIFQPFFTTKGPNEGSGLGLSITSDIVHRLGGEIEVESLDTGSLFKIVLPQRTALQPMH